MIFTRGYTNGLQRQSANCKTNLEITGLSAMGQLKVSAKETIPDYRSASQMNSIISSNPAKSAKGPSTAPSQRQNVNHSLAAYSRETDRLMTLASLQFVKKPKA